MRNLRLEMRVACAHDRLDRELACGISPERTPELHRRAVQLSCSRSRRQLATALERLRRISAEPRRPAITAAVRPDVLALRECGALIERIVHRLRDDRVVRAEGLARLNVLLTDPGSPLYCCATRGTLGERLRDVLVALDPGGRGPSS